MNSAVTTIDDVARRCDSNKLIVMCPGDEWELGDGPFKGTGAAIDKYRRDWETVEALPLKCHESYEMKQILEVANKNSPPRPGC